MSALADVLEVHRDEVIRRWKELAPSEAELVGCLPTLLAALVQSLRGESTAGRASTRELMAQVSGQHDGLRFRKGLDLQALMREYDLLCGCILDVAEEERVPLALADVRALTAFLADGMIAATARVTPEQQEGESSRGREYETTAPGARERAAHVELALAQHQLREFFEKAPAVICLLQGPTHVYALANARYRELIGQRELLGKPIREALPELEGQGFFELLDRVYATGEAFLGNEIPARLDRRGDGTSEEGFFNFVYQPTRDVAGRVDGIAVFAFEVTDLVRARQRAESLSREHQRAVEVLEHGDALFVLDRDFRFILVNENQERISQTSRKDTLGRVFWEVFPAAAAPESKYWQEYHRVMRERVPVQFEEYYAPLDVWTDVSVYPTREGGIAVFFRDITAYKRAEAALRASEERNRAVLAALAEGIVFQDAQGVLVMANASAERLLGLTFDQMAGRTSLDPRWGAVHPDGSPYPGEEHPSMVALRTGQPQHNREMGIHHPDGKLVWISINAQPLFQADGRTPAGVVTSSFDITDRKRQEEERARLLAREQAAHAEAEAERLRLHTLFMQAPVPIAVWSGPEHTFELTNPPFEQLVGRRHLIGKPVRALLPELKVQGPFELLDRVYRTGEPITEQEYAMRLNRKGGGVLEEVFFTFSLVAIRDASKRVTGVMMAGVEMTEQVRARRRVEEALAELQAVIDGNPDAIYIGTTRGIHRANATALQMLGFHSIEELNDSIATLAEKIRLRELRTGAPLPGDQSAFGRALRGETVVMEGIVYNAAKQEDIIVRSMGYPIRLAGEVIGAVAFNTDVTEQKRLEEEQQRLAALIENSSDYIGLATLEGVSSYLNEAGQRLVGLTGLEQVRRTHLIEYFPPGEQERVQREILPIVWEKGRWEGELHFRHFRTGETIPVLWNVFVIRDRSSGEPLSLATITRDIREQKRAEATLKALYQRAEEASRLKDEFLATVSHELKTPLTAMLGWVQLLRAGRLPPEREARALETVERNARAQAQLIEDLLDVSRIVTGKLRLEVAPLDVMDVVDAAMESARPVAQAKGVHLVREMASGGSVRGDASRLQQVVWNLLSNAVKFTPKGGTVRVRVGRTDSSVEISISDTGQGIPPSFVPHLFERFRQADASTTRAHGGLGLGLSIVKHLVELHGGAVRAHSEGEGKGATFTVSLPLVAPRPGRGEERKPPTPAGGECPPGLPGLRVLLVEDDADTRELVRALLERCEAQVTTAASVREGLELFEREHPDAIVCDIGMPGEDGYAFISRVRALPEARGGRTPAVALTAYSRPEDRRRSLLAGFNMHVPKPIDPAELLVVLATLGGRAVSA